jgi:hypothetical protein
MNEMFDSIPDGVKHLIDFLSITTLLGTLAQMLPHVAASLTIVWTGLRIYETKTVQGWLGRK